MAYQCKDSALFCYCCGSGLIPVLGTSACHRCGPKKKKKLQESYLIIDISALNLLVA